MTFERYQRGARRVPSLPSGEKADIIELVEAYRSGLTAGQVGAKFGICEDTVLRRLRAVGEPLRHRGDRAGNQE